MTVFCVLFRIKLLKYTSLMYLTVFFTILTYIQVTQLYTVDPIRGFSLALMMLLILFITIFIRIFCQLAVLNTWLSHVPIVIRVFLSFSWILVVQVTM